MEWNVGWFCLVLAGLVLGAIAGFFLARRRFERELQKSPPVKEQMRRAMCMEMGRKPSEAQIRKVMNSMKKNSSL